MAFYIPAIFPPSPCSLVTVISWHYRLGQVENINLIQANIKIYINLDMVTTRQKVTNKKFSINLDMVVSVLGKNFGLFCGLSFSSFM